mmetsp:Transcript_2733/g.4968  ORF Transcript_2733/g.4968 Transcript_2733/m.4968 type:complete len:662 (-) Transcript_2733:4412-6397(-)
MHDICPELRMKHRAVPIRQSGVTKMARRRASVAALVFMCCSMIPVSCGFNVGPLLTRRRLSERIGVSVKATVEEETDKMAPASKRGISGYSISGAYSRSLLGEKERKRMERKKKAYELERNEDGYADMFRNKKLWRRMFRVAKRILVGPRTPNPGTLILVRHGESLWNANKTFTGWADPDLSEQGKREIEHAARLLLEGGYEIDVVFTSRLKRAIRSSWILLQELNEVYLPVFKSWRLNERMYGALTGLSKKETAEQLGHELVQAWRGSLRSRPPPLRRTDKYWPGRDERYFDISTEKLPLTESLEDCMNRTAPVWEDKIAYELSQGRNVLVVAHANTLRGLVKIIDRIGDDEIQDVAIPTGIPIVYKFDKHMVPIPPTRDDQTAAQVHMNGLFLEKPGILKAALTREAEWCSRVPGYDKTMTRKFGLSPLERSLTKLQAERDLGAWAGKFVDLAASTEDDGTDGKLNMIEDDIWDAGLNALEEGQQFDPDFPDFHPSSTNGDLGMIDSAPITPQIISNEPCVTLLPSTGKKSSGEIKIRKDAVVVIIRHGKTEHNKLGLFTGWEDVPLAKEGIEEACAAGRLLKQHGFTFDVVYTSWLSRAIETAWYVMDELDILWLPIIKSWRLNERMYGSLTGLSKRMVSQRHGVAQFTAWRRGFKVK